MRLVIVFLVLGIAAKNIFRILNRKREDKNRQEIMNAVDEWFRSL